MVTKKTFYAVKALAYLAKQPDRPAYSAEIATAQNIPKHFLEKILTELSAAGYLSVTKGRKGGYSLTLGNGEINAATILHIMQDKIIPLPCVDDVPIGKCIDCEHKAACGVQETFAHLKNRLSAILKEADLNSLVQLSDTHQRVSEDPINI